MKYLWNKTNLMPERFLFALQHQFGSLLSRSLPQYPKATGHYFQISAGGELYLFPITNQFRLNPYIGLGGGYLMEAAYSHEEVVDPSIRVGSPMVHTEAGIKLMGPLDFISQNCVYGLSVHYNYDYVLSPSEQILLDRSHMFLQSSGFLGVGFFVGIDF